jgi:hypothetical protein
LVSVQPFILSKRLEHPLPQALRHSPAFLGPLQGLPKVLLELDARITGLADLQMAPDLLLGYTLELTVQIFEEAGAGFVAGDHRDIRVTGRTAASGRCLVAGPAVLARASE